VAARHYAGMRYDIPAAAAEIAQSQAGAISRKQLLDAGLSAQLIVIDGRAVYRDVYYEEYKLAAELDGRLAHPDQERWRDTHRDNQAGAQGILTTRYGWRDVYGHPCETALLQARILRERGWTGTPRPCSASCPVGRA
jgi:hypothetical protein